MICIILCDVQFFVRLESCCFSLGSTDCFWLECFQNGDRACDLVDGKGIGNDIALGPRLTKVARCWK